LLCSTTSTNFAGIEELPLFPGSSIAIVIGALLSLLGVTKERGLRMVMILLARRMMMTLVISASAATVAALPALSLAGLRVVSLLLGEAAPEQAVRWTAESRLLLLGHAGVVLRVLFRREFARARLPLLLRQRSKIAAAASMATLVRGSGVNCYDTEESLVH